MNDPNFERQRQQGHDPLGHLSLAYLGAEPETNVGNDIKRTTSTFSGNFFYYRTPFESHSC